MEMSGDESSQDGKEANFALMEMSPTPRLTSKRHDGKMCGVCGDKALGYNFNAITCESCKAFFRRNALKNKEYRCPFNDQCDVTTVTRRFCQRCRLRKCFKVGMKKEWIMSEADKKKKKKKIELNKAKKDGTEENEEGEMSLEISVNQSVSSPPYDGVDPNIDCSPLTMTSISSPQSDYMSEIVGNQQHIPSSDDTNCPNMPLLPLSSDEHDRKPLFNPNSSLHSMQHSLSPSVSSINALKTTEIYSPLPPSEEIRGNQCAETKEDAFHAFPHTSSRDGTQKPQAVVIGRVRPTEDPCSHKIRRQTSKDDVHSSMRLIAPSISSIPSPHPGFYNEVPLSDGVVANMLKSPPALVAIVSKSDSGSPSCTLDNQWSNIHSSVIVKREIGSDNLDQFISSDPLDLCNSSSSVAYTIASNTSTNSVPNCLVSGATADLVDRGTGPSSEADTFEFNIQDVLRRLHSGCREEESLPKQSSGQTMMDSIVNTAIQSEYSALSLLNCVNSQTELNQTEQIKIYELVEASRGLMAPLCEDANFKDLPNPNSLINIINLTEIAIRRLIKMAKRISSFKNLCQEDQIALLKAGCTEMMILRSVSAFDPDKESWKIQQDGERFKDIQLKVLQAAQGKIYEEHKRFMHAFKPDWRQDVKIMSLLCAIALFTPERPNVKHFDAIRHEQSSYLYLLKRYLEVQHGGCEGRTNYYQLLRRISDLHVLNDEHVRVFLQVNPKEVEPLLIEIFDLKQS